MAFGPASVKKFVHTHIFIYPIPLDPENVPKLRSPYNATESSETKSAFNRFSEILNSRLVRQNGW